MTRQKKIREPQISSAAQMSSSAEGECYAQVLGGREFVMRLVGGVPTIVSEKQISSPGAVRYFRLKPMGNQERKIRTIKRFHRRMELPDGTVKILRWWQQNFDGAKIYDHGKSNVIRIETPGWADMIATLKSRFDEVSEEDYRLFREAQRSRGRKDEEE